MSLRIAATRLTELHTVKLMIGGNGGVNPSSDSQTLNVCDGGVGSFTGFHPYLSLHSLGVDFGLFSNTERAPLGESVVSLVGLTR